MLGGGNGVPAGRVHHDDPACGRGIDIDIVHPDAGASDGFEILGRGDDIRADFGLAAHHEGGELGDDLQQFVVRQPRLESDIQLTSLGQGIDAGLRNGIRDKNFGFGHGEGNLRRTAATVTLTMAAFRSSGRDKPAKLPPKAW